MVKKVFQQSEKVFQSKPTTNLNEVNYSKALSK
jgi:hypothetical protein